MLDIEGYDGMPERHRFFSEFLGERDRAAAILAGVYLEELLTQLLRSFLIDDDRSVDEVLKGDGRPLGTFSAKIDMAYCLGLIAGNVRNELHQIRRIRNDFAHGEHGLTFELAPMRDRCNNLVLAFEGRFIDPTALETRFRFQQTVIFIGEYIERKAPLVTGGRLKAIDRAKVVEIQLAQNQYVIGLFDENEL